MNSDLVQVGLPALAGLIVGGFLTRLWKPRESAVQLGFFGVATTLVAAGVLLVGLLWGGFDWDLGCSALMVFTGVAAAFGVAALVHSLRRASHR